MHIWNVYLCVSVCIRLTTSYPGKTICPPEIGNRLQSYMLWKRQTKPTLLTIVFYSNLQVYSELWDTQTTDRLTFLWMVVSSVTILFTVLMVSTFCLKAIKISASTYTNIKYHKSLLFITRPLNWASASFYISFHFNELFFYIAVLWHLIFEEC